MSCDLLVESIISKIQSKFLLDNIFLCVKKHLLLFLLNFCSFEVFKGFLFLIS